MTLEVAGGACLSPSDVSAAHRRPSDVSAARRRPSDVSAAHRRTPPAAGLTSRPHAAGRLTSRPHTDGHRAGPKSTATVPGRSRLPPQQSWELPSLGQWGWPSGNSVSCAVDSIQVAHWQWTRKADSAEGGQGPPPDQDPPVGREYGLSSKSLCT